MQIQSLAFALTISVVTLVSTPAAADVGHCTYVQQGRVESHDVCEAPTDAETCTAIGAAEGHSEASYQSGACPIEGRVGTCDKGATRIEYFNGDPSQLEIGCGFQGGTWLNP